MTTAEAATTLGISVRRVQQFIKSGRLKADKRGRDFWIEPDELESIKERKNGRPRK